MPVWKTEDGGKGAPCASARWRALLLGAVFAGIAAVAPGTVAAPGAAVATPPYVAPAAVLEAVTAKAARLGADGSAALRRDRLAGRAAPDSLRAVVLLCDFADSLLYGRYGDVPGDFPPPRQSDFYFAAHDSLYFAHLLADVAHYFTAVSGGRFTLACDIVGAVANLPLPMSWYGNDPDQGEQPVLLARDVVALLDPQIDFSRYDTVILIHAGAGEETDILGNSPEQVYSTYLGPEDFARAAGDEIIPEPFLATGDLGAGGEPAVVDQVLVLPETEFQDPYAGYGGYFGSLGVYCFEVGLRLGMLSLSDFTPEGYPDSQGVGEFDLMGYGLFVGAGYIPCHPSAFNKMLMGWVEPYRVEPGDAETYRLDAIESAAGDSAAARVEIGGREYWLLEYRLQDPDGNRIFSFAGDLNGNNIPDFWDANSAYGDGTPTDFFDPATDTVEQLVGAEWDFFMSENAARPPGVKGAGSGLYVWHIDEGVIADVIDSPTNLFNADARRKSVDLEEADGIQDLDSRRATDSVSAANILGGDFDSFRGENNATFGPDTNPDTRSAGGAWTGVAIDRVSNVVADSSLTVDDPPRTIIGYAESMTFRCWRQEAAEGGPVLAAERALDGVDLTGSHLLAVDLDATPDGRLEIVAGGAGGELFAFESDLTEQFDGDGDPETIGVLARGTDADGAPVRWNGPAAAGDLDSDGRPEIVLTAPGGLYAFQGEDGGELADGDGDPDSFGLLTPLSACALPPVLLPAGSLPYYDPGQPVVACVAELDDAPAAARLRFLDGEGQDACPAVELGAVAVPAMPVPVADALLALAVTDTATGRSAIALVSWSLPSAPTLLATLSLALTPGPFPLTALDAVGLRGVAVIDSAGAAESVWWDEDLALARRDLWPAGTPVQTPLSVSRAFAGAGRLSRATIAGFPETGWPIRPRPELDISPPGTAPSPLEASLADGRVILFQGRDGRLYLQDEAGRTRAGWPVAGPSATAGTPLLLDLDGDGELDLCAAGAFARILGREPDTGALLTEPLSRLAVWTGIGAELPAASGWPMWGGNPWRLPLPSPVDDDIRSSGLLSPGSLLTYPSPLASGPLHVRADFLTFCTARAVLHDLAGEVVAASGRVAVPEAGPFEIVLPVERIASGLYLCRLIAEREGRELEVGVVPVAVAR